MWSNCKRQIFLQGNGRVGYTFYDLAVCVILLPNMPNILSGICCRKMEIGTSKKKDLFDYSIKEDEGCPYTPIKVNELGHLKLVTTRTDSEATYCLMVWTCRTTRKGFHAWCNNNDVSIEMYRLIGEAFRGLGKKAIYKLHNYEQITTKC